MKEYIIATEISDDELVADKPATSYGELVRCKDCKFAKLIDEEDDWYECLYDKRVMHDDGYCSWAERKEE